MAWIFQFVISLTLLLMAAPLEAQSGLGTYIGSWRIDLDATESFDQATQPFRITIAKHESDLLVERVTLGVESAERSHFDLENRASQMVELTKYGLVITESRTRPDGSVEQVVDTYLVQRNSLALQRIVSDGADKVATRLVYLRLPVNEALHGGVPDHVH